MDADGYIGLVDAVQTIFKDFRSAWYLGCTTFCYLVIQILRGKAGFQVPWVTAKLEKVSREMKTIIILGVFVVIGFLGAFAQKSISFTTILDGLLGGLALGVGTIGTRNAVKQSIDEVKAVRAAKIASADLPPPENKPN